MVWVTPELFVMRPPTVRVLFEIVKLEAPGAKVIVPVDRSAMVSTEVFLFPVNVMAAPAAGLVPAIQFDPVDQDPLVLPLQVAAEGVGPVVKVMLAVLLLKIPFRLLRPTMLVVKLPL